MIGRRDLLWRGAALLALTGSAAEAAPRPRPRVARPWPRLTGVNIAGLEFGEAALPGQIGKDYVAPSAAELAYFAGKGLRTVRIPFLWERVQPQPFGELDADYFGLLAQIVAAAQALGMTVILDLHNFGRRRFAMSGQISDGGDRVTGLASTEGLVVGLAVEGDGISKGAEVWQVLDENSFALSRRATASGQVMLQIICPLGQSPLVSPAHFADVWKRLAARFADAPNVVFGLMNEPHDQDGVALAASYNAAIRAIRAAGAGQLVLAAGEGWSSGKNWFDSGAAATLSQVADPGGRLAFEVHQYLDWDGSGHYPLSRGGPRHQPGAGAGRLIAVTDWARSRGAKLFLGECGVPGESGALRELEAQLDFVNANRDVWLGFTAWAAGAWWAPDDALSLEPLDAGADKPQLATFIAHAA